MPSKRNSWDTMSIDPSNPPIVTDDVEYKWVSAYQSSVPAGYTDELLLAAVANIKGAEALTASAAHARSEEAQFKRSVMDRWTRSGRQSSHDWETAVKLINLASQGPNPDTEAGSLKYEIDTFATVDELSVTRSIRHLYETADFLLAKAGHKKKGKRLFDRIGRLARLHAHPDHPELSTLFLSSLKSDLAASGRTDSRPDLSVAMIDFVRRCEDGQPGAEEFHRTMQKLDRQASTGSIGWYQGRQQIQRAVENLTLTPASYYPPDSLQGADVAQKSRDVDEARRARSGWISVKDCSSRAARCH